MLDDRQSIIRKNKTLFPVWVPAVVLVADDQGQYQIHTLAGRVA
ncbi:hypothetical protein RRG08_010804 [Elysia crispata]|uniref:Uncharacterized protein n=1 Tax=Elysia crispata TaxID=231223 RepID=A0AAE1DEW0_9GAST|nr:hypothetical protein RRG08_010804 [Elysia crispata]